MCTRSDFPPYDHADCDHGCLLGDPDCPKRPETDAERLARRLSAYVGTPEPLPSAPVIPEGPDTHRYEAGAELTIDDLAALATRACELGAAAATADDRHFAAEAFDRAREHLDRAFGPREAAE